MQIRLQFACALGLAMLVQQPAGAQQTLHVPGGFATIQAAVDAAQDGDTVLVGPGVYRESVRIMEKAIRLWGTAGAPSTKIVGTGSSVVTLFHSAGNPQLLTRIIGFTLEGGTGTLHPSDGLTHGGGVYANSIAVELDRCHVRDNHVTGDGGGVFIRWTPAAGQSHLSVAFLEENSAGRDGGGVFVTSEVIGPVSVNSGIHVVRSALGRNEAGRHGGGLAAVLSRTRFLGCLIEANRAGGQGGGVYLRDSGFDSLQAFYDSNKAQGSGGGACMVATDLGPGFFTAPRLRDHTSRYTDNVAGQSGGGLAIERFETVIGDPVELIAGEFSGNRSGGDGGGLWIAQQGVGAKKVFLSSSTLTDNVAAGSGNDAHYQATGNANFWLDSTIAWGSGPGSIVGATTFGPCDIEGGAPDPDVVDVDPLFIDPGLGGYSLSATSPVRGLGSNGTDLGAYQYEPEYVLGHGTFGREGLLYLSNSGSPSGAITIHVHFVDPRRPVAIVMGASGLGIPALGATLYPTPDVIRFGFLQPSGGSPSGTLELASPPIPGLIDRLYLQVWVEDGFGESGWVASNGLVLEL